MIDYKSIMVIFFFELQNFYLKKYFFSLNINKNNFLIKKTLNIKTYFCSISATIGLKKSWLTVKTLQIS